MVNTPNITFKNLKVHISEAIKESCYRLEVRIYNIARDVLTIPTFSSESGIEVADGFLKIISRTIKDSVALGCDEDVIVKGIMLGAFRAALARQESQKTIRYMITEIIKVSINSKADIKKVIEGILASIVVISREFKQNAEELLILAKEDIVTSAGAIGYKFTDEMKDVLSNSNGMS